MNEQTSYPLPEVLDFTFGIAQYLDIEMAL